MKTFLHLLGSAALLAVFAAPGLAQSKVQPTADAQPQARLGAEIGLRFADNKYEQAARVDELFISDFSDGDDWTVIANYPDTPVWKITTDDTFTGSFTRATFEGASIESGFAVLNYDEAFGGSFSPETVDQILESPAYDISSLDSGLYELAFFTQRRFCCTFRTPGSKVSFSYDNGVTFSEPAVVERYFDANDEFNGVAGVLMPPRPDTATQFKVRFSFDGDFYYWAVDDIRIRPQAPRDIILQSNFVAAPPYALIPATQVEDNQIDLLVDVLNRGAESSTFEVVATVYTVVDGALGEVLNQDSLTYTSVIYDSLAENQIFPVRFPYPREVGQYVLEYEVSFPDTLSDTNPDNNRRTARFDVTENEFSKSYGTVTGLRSVDDDDGSLGYEVGNVYYYPKIGETTTVDSIAFTQFNRSYVASSLAEVELDVNIYGTFGDLDNDGVSSEEELEYLETVTVGIPPSFLGSAGDRTDIKAYFGEEGYPLTDDYPAYAFTVTYTPPEVDSVGNFFIGVGRELGAQEFASEAFDSTFVNSVYRETLDADTQLDYSGIGGRPPVIRVYSSTTFSVDTRDELGTNEISISPNPANDYVDLALDLERSAKRVLVEVVNATGQTVSTLEQNSIQATRVRVPTAHLPAGVYYLHVSLDGDRAASRTVLVSH